MRINRNSEYSTSKQDKEHLKFGLPPADLDANILKFNRKIFLSVLTLIAITAVIWLLGLSSEEKTNITIFVSNVITSDLFYQAMLVGLLAQLVDGSLGMAYGITSSSFLIGIGASPAAASGAVHIAEIFTTGFSGISHIKFGNVRKDLFKKLVMPGVLGGIIGAYILTSIDGKLIKPYITAYLLIMGLFILRKVFVSIKHHDQKIKHVRKLAFSGGFLDAIGGGGWGPVVTSTLIGQGNSPRHTIGSVNTAEFFVSFATGITFMLLGGIDHWIFVAGLIIGGLFSAPFAAYLTSRLSTKKLLIAVGLLITGISIFNLYKIFG
ncbi:MAG: sulfite exporter TauE/SafE family protein [Candidatus Methylopumilus sp.]|nr:sulfite exporter TauE/SafE family protein [Candidatus Methylopumilus sp.]